MVGAGYTLNGFSVAIMKIKGCGCAGANNRMMFCPIAQAIDFATVPSQNHPARREEEYERKTTSLAGMPGPRQVQHAPCGCGINAGDATLFACLRLGSTRQGWGCAKLV